MFFILTIALGIGAAAVIPVLRSLITSDWNVHRPEADTDLPTLEEFPAERYKDHLRLGKMIQVIYDIFNNNGKSELYGNTILVTEDNLKRLVEETFPGYKFERRLRTIIRVQNDEDATSFMGYILTKTLPNGKSEVVIAYRGTVTTKEWLEDASTFATVWNSKGGIDCDECITPQFSLNDYLQMMLPKKIYQCLPFTKNDPIKLHNGFKRMYVNDRDVRELSDVEIENVLRKLKSKKDLTVEEFKVLPVEERRNIITYDVNHGVLKGLRTRLDVCELSDVEIEKVLLKVRERKGLTIEQFKAHSVEERHDIVTYDAGHGVLQGPQTRCRALLDDLLKTHNLEKVTVTGHSLGASLAIITALDLAQYLSSKPEKDRVKVEAVTFACPKVGNYRFLDALEKAGVRHYHHHVRGDFIPFTGFFSNFRKEEGGLYQPFRYGKEMPFLHAKYRRPKLFVVTLLVSTLARKTEYLGVYHSLDVILHNLCHNERLEGNEIPRSIAFVNRGGDFLDSKYSPETKNIPPYWFTGLANRGMHMRDNGEIGEITSEELKADKSGQLQRRLDAFIDLYAELSRNEGKKN
eukprot:gene6920-7653_t